MTSDQADQRVSGAVFYDADCPFCVKSAQRFAGMLARGHYRLVPLQSSEAHAAFPMPPDELLSEMRLRTPDGATFGGAGAVMEILRHVWWGWPLWALSRLPGAMVPLNAAYRAVAARRSCAHGACAVPRPTPGGSAVLPVILLPLAAWWLAAECPRWVLMWALSFALYAGCKWLTYREARNRGANPSMQRRLGYLFAWPGMDAISFFDDTARIAKPAGSEWLTATAKTLSGIALLIAEARGTFSWPPLLTGWLGMVGAVLILHFGSFALLSLAWRSAGINAIPLMQKPLRSTSLAEFWGRRWNTAFHELATRFTFRPLRRALSPTAAALLVFVASGLLHDLVISVPARGGYGLPTAYFLIQGLATAAERSSFGRGLGLGSGWRGWLFTILTVAGPAVILFHPPFVHNVILPMLAAIAGLERSL
jgi:predicted DCC family thiol-disulfide oxidoreductase YuxK